MAPKDFPWPKKGDKAFVDGDPDESLHLKSIIGHLPPHAEAFKVAAEMVIDAYHNRPRLGHRDDLFFPVSYLYRHCLELKLKELIRLGLSLRFYTPADRIKLKGKPRTATDPGKPGILQGHNLANLWNFTKKLLTVKFEREDQSPLLGTESVIQDFHLADPTGQALRYDRDNDGRRHEHKTVSEFVDLNHLRSRVDGVCSFLDCCYDCLHNELTGWDGP